MDQCLVLFFFLSQKHRLHWPTSTCASKMRIKLCSPENARGGKFLLRWPNKQRDAQKTPGQLGIVQNNNGLIWGIFGLFRLSKTFLKHFKFHCGECEVLFWGRGADSSHSVSSFISEETCENLSWLFSSSLMWPSALCQYLTKSKGRTGSSCIILFSQCRFD